jgi:GNAT superfamily N-acetyltransferase
LAWVNVWLRPAHPAEASVLSELALRSKAHWGYDKEFLDACRAELTVTADDIATGRVVVAAANGRLVGFYTVDGAPPDGELGNLWVEPGAIGVGLGRRLWKHAVNTARAAGFTTLRIESDPHAEGFYLAMGATRVGESPSASVPGRALPLLRFRLP